VERVETDARHEGEVVHEKNELLHMWRIHTALDV
jgi:hypothetical protein